MLSTFGTISLSIPAIICMVSVASLPIMILPPTVTLPVTSKLPVTVTSESRFISPLAASKFASPERVSTVLPLIRQLPVSILVPSINVLLAPSVNVTPPVVLIVKSDTEKLTVPSA